MSTFVYAQAKITFVIIILFLYCPAIMQEKYCFTQMAPWVLGVCCFMLYVLRSEQILSFFYLPVAKQHYTATPSHAHILLLSARTIM